MQKYKNLIKMYKEIGKWFLDVAKYIVTAFILTNMFVKVDTVMSVVGAILIMVLLFGIGVFFLKRDKN